MRSRHSGVIWDALVDLPGFASASLVGGFIGFGEEVETAGQLRDLIARGRRVAVPCLASPDGEPSFSEVRSWHDLGSNAYGIL